MNEPVLTDQPQAAPALEPVAAAPRRRKAPKVVGVVLASAVLATAAIYLASHNHAKANLATEPPRPVSAAKIQHADLWREVEFNAEFLPFQEVDLHAKVAGYVQSITVDVGDHVKEGDVIATLELPEVEADIERAVAMEKRAEEEVNRAEAAYDEAHLGYTRVQAIHKAQPRLVAQQDVDAALAKDRTAGAAFGSARLQVDVAKADLRRLRTMLAYAKITAPFSGVVTRRFADKGALIQAGTSSSTQAMPLIRLSQNDRLRLVFPVSVSHVSSVQPGTAVEIHISSLGQTVQARVTRIAGKVETRTRTMDAEVDLPNSDFRFIPGAYASVSIKLGQKTAALAVPVEALSAQKRGTVLVINDDVIEERAITLGLETATKVEALTGLKEGDLVLLGSRSGVKAGQRVVPRIVDVDREHSL